MDFKFVNFEIREGVARIILNRPERLNALTYDLLDELHAALRQTAASEFARVLLLTGEGRGFCAGADLTAPRPVDPNNPKEALRDYLNPAFQLLKSLSIPTVAAVNGPAVGAGMSLALSCDLVLAARSAYFLSAFVNIGLVPDAGASWILTQTLGEARARGMMLLGERLSAQSAADWGLIWKCVEDVELKGEADNLLSKLASGAPRAYSLTRQLIRSASQNTLPSQMQLEAEFQAVLRSSEDAQEARKAFAEKRPPVFKGR